MEKYKEHNELQKTKIELLEKCVDNLEKQIEGFDVVLRRLEWIQTHRPDLWRMICECVYASSCHTEGR